MADIEKLDEVEGIGEVRARTIKQSLKRNGYKLKEYIISDIDDFGLEGIQFNLEHLEESRKIKLDVPGRHNAINASVAIAVGCAVGITMEEAKHALIIRINEYFTEIA